MKTIFSQWVEALRARANQRRQAKNLYRQCCALARQPFFYQNRAIPDNAQGHFELIILHLWLLLRHLRRLSSDYLARRVVAEFFSDLDGNLRQAGTSDLAVPDQIKTMAGAFYGRLKAYDEALETDKTKEDRLTLLFENNLSPKGARQLAADALACDMALRDLFYLGLSPFIARDSDIFSKTVTRYIK